MVWTQVLLFWSPHCQRATAICWIGLFIERGVAFPAVEKFALKLCIMYLYFSVDLCQFPYFSPLCCAVCRFDTCKILHTWLWHWHPHDHHVQSVAASRGTTYLTSTIYFHHLSWVCWMAYLAGFRQRNLLVKAQILDKLTFLLRYFFPCNV